MLSRHTKRALLGFLFAGVFLVVVGAAISHYFAARALEIRLEQERSELVEPEPMLLTVERSDRTRERAYAVRLQPYRRTSVAAETSGRVEEVLVEAGDSIEKDQVIVRLDATLPSLVAESAKAAVEAGEAQLRELRRRVREAERLADAQSIPETQLEEARSQAEVQERELERLRAEARRQEEILARHEVRAPFSGNVNQRLVETGDSVNVNQALVSLVTLDPLRVRFYVSDIEVGSFRAGDSLPLRLSAFPGREFEAPVVSVARATDPVSGLYMIEARVPNPDELISSGVRGRLLAQITHYSDTLFVPASAVRFEGRRAWVDLWRDGEVHARQLELGEETDGDYPVLAGLNEGDVLVIR